MRTFDWQLPQRILVAYILFSMYAPYPITINPFKSVLLVTFVRERNSAIRAAANEGGVSTNEQLVWVLWKILKGDGNDVRKRLFFSRLGANRALNRLVLILQARWQDHPCRPS